jgi:hypothetical protein
VEGATITGRQQAALLLSLLRGAAAASWRTPLALSRAIHAILSHDHCLSRVRERPFQLSRIEPYHRARAATVRGDEADRLTSNLKHKERPMKTIVSALVALSVLAGIAAPANAALDAKTFFEKMDSARYALDTKAFFEQTDRARY